MHITLDTYPNSGGFVLHLDDHEIKEIVEDYYFRPESASGWQLRILLERWLIEKEKGAQS